MLNGYGLDKSVRRSEWALRNSRHRSIGRSGSAVEDSFRVDHGGLVLQVGERLADIELRDDLVEITRLVQEVVGDVAESEVGVSPHVVAERLQVSYLRKVTEVDSADIDSSR